MIKLLFLQLIFVAFQTLLASAQEDAICSIPTSSKVIRVNQSSGNDSVCQEDRGLTLCPSLELANHLLKEYRDDVTIIVEGNATLNGVFSVVNSTNILIIGNSTTTRSRSHVYNASYINCKQEDAGFMVDSVRRFAFCNIAVVKCSIKSTSGDYPAMLVQFSINVTMRNTHFQNCSSTAVMMLNNSGTVSLQNVTFTNNFKFAKRRKHHEVNVSYPAALSIQLDADDRTTQDYHITHCVFHYNESPKIRQEYILEDGDLSRYVNRGYGGALFIEFGGHTTGSSVVVEDTNFTFNTAVRGGGIYAYYKDAANNNTIRILRSIFFGNNADISGGGVNFGFHNSPSLNNTITITDCQFVNNTSLYGAGLTVYSSYSEDMSTRSSGPVIMNSTWRFNSGVLSSAVDVAPLHQSLERGGYLPVPQFLNCSFESNSIDNTLKKSNRTYHINTGVFSVTKFKVIFGSTTKFLSNQYSAVVLVSSIIEFQKNSHVLFQGNVGYNGGAIAMYGFSTIIFNVYSLVNFSRNHAINNGGAIYHKTSDQHTFLRGSVNCFLRNRVSNRSLIASTKVYFENNTAEIAGTSIYSESFRSCFRRCLRQLNDRFSIDKVFQCVGNFEFPVDNNTNHHPMASSGRAFKFHKDSKPLYPVIPGDSIKLPYHIVDDFNNEIQPLLSVSSVNVSAVYVSDPYSTSNVIRPHGDTGVSSGFRISALGVRQIYSVFEISLLPCPPGYHNKGGSCLCAADKGGYNAITKCRDDDFTAIYKGSQWFGYIPPNATDYTHLYFAQCAAPICNENNRQLPRERGSLTTMICAQNREGIMCGKCAYKHSTYYHSRNLTCGPNKYCNLGPLFYFISEIIPMVIFFVIIVTFDLSFTSGKTVSFIFFTQYLNQLTVPVSPFFEYLRIPYRIFYGLFNFEFFNVEKLSFCLWHGAQILDVVAIRYCTIIAALLLVFIFIGVLSHTSCARVCYLRGYVSTKTSVVHGLSAFLVICYAQCSKTSFYILKYTRPVGFNDTLETYYTYYGGLPYFSRQHLIYAVPALLSLVFVTILPPLVLLLYPLSLHLLSLCGLSEHWVVNKTLRFTCINKLKPFIDCFQSCYKDKLRFFAGLYFVYRVVILLVFSVSGDSFSFSIYSEILLVFLLGIHALVQPYKEPLHNVLDTLIFFNLSLINGCAIVSKLWITKLKDPSSRRQDPHILLASFIQLFLLYLPMFVVLLQLGRIGYARVKPWCKRSRDQSFHQSRTVEVEDILNRDFDQNSIHSSSSHSESSYRSAYGSLEDTY